MFPLRYLDTVFFLSAVYVWCFFMDSYYENKSFLWKSGRKVTFLRTPSPVHTYEQAFRCRKYRYHDQLLEFSTYISRNDLNIFFSDVTAR